MKRILFFIFLSSVSPSILGAHGGDGTNETEKGEREALIQQLIEEARKSLVSDSQIAKGFYAIARLATDHSHHHRAETDTHLDKNPMTVEEIKMAITAIKYLQRTRSAATWVGNLFK